MCYCLAMMPVWQYSCSRPADTLQVLHLPCLQVFVGAFRGKGFKPPPKGRPQLKKPGGSRCMEQHQHDEQDEQVQEDEETETEGKEQSEEEEEQGTASQQTVERQQLEKIEGIEQQHKQPSALDGAGAEGQQQQGVLLWPSAAGAAGSTGEGFQR